MIGRIFSTITALCVLLTVGLILYAFGIVRVPIFEKQLSELETECVVAAIHSDARWSGDADLVVRREVGRAVLRHARLFRRDVCDVFRRGLTLVPEAYKRWGWYFRSEKYVRNSLEATDASWKSDLQLVHDLLKEKNGEGCATHYLRKARKSDWVAQPETARKLIRSTMKSVGKAKENGRDVGDAEFFCFFP